MMNQPFEVKDFSGGFTDDYLAGPQNRGQLFDNLLINNNRKPFSRQGSEIRDETNYQIPSGNKRISYLWDHRDQILEQSERHIYFLDGTYQELTGPTGNEALGIGDEDSHVSKAFWNNHSVLVSDSGCNPIKIYFDNSDVLQVRNAGLPALANDPTVTAGGAGANNYIYAFLYYYSYNVEGVTFADFGATTQVALNSAAAPDSSTVAITNIPVISNGATENWDTSNIKVKIYRTENNQTVLKFIGEVTNGTTTYNDSASDASITDNEVIYTDGGVVDNDPAPPAKYIHIANDIALYGVPTEDSVQVPNKVRQSIKGDFDSCPEDFFDEFTEEITGISSYQGIFIVFSETSTYRLDGFFDEQGRGGISHLKISDVYGTISNDSIVQTDDGLFFFSKEGLCFTDGYKVRKISKHLNNTYQNIISNTPRNIWGAYDKKENRVWWAIQQDSSSLDNDSCIILDLQWGISDESTFTTASNETYFAPTCLLFKDEFMYRADKRGYILRHDSSLFTDPKIDTLNVPADWNRKTIIYDYKSCAFDFGTSFVRKFVPKILLSLGNRTNIAVTMFSINDDGRKTAELTPIRYNSNITWGDPEVIWGDPNIIWNRLGIIEEKRMFPAMSLRCNYKQIRITNAYTPVSNSDMLGNATVSASLKTVTFDNLANSWPQDSVDYYISFEDDDYDTQFLITERTSDTVLTFQDAANESPSNGSYQWLIKGYRKDEAILILSYVIHYKMLTDSQKSFHNVPGDTGENET